MSYTGLPEDQLVVYPLDSLSVPLKIHYFPIYLLQRAKMKFIQFISNNVFKFEYLTFTGSTLIVFELKGNTVKSSFTTRHRLQSANDKISLSLKRQVTV